MRPVCQLSSEAQCRRVLDAVACAVQVEMQQAEMQTVFEARAADEEAPPSMYAQPPPAVDVESQALLPAPPPAPAEMRPFSFMYEFVGRAFGLR
jgi:hypothetical protein